MALMGTYRQGFAFQEFGTMYRNLNGPAAVAQLGLTFIKQARLRAYEAEPKQDVVFVLQSLKRKEEVDLLRDEFGNSFFLLSATSSRAVRSERLALEIGPCVFG